MFYLWSQVAFQRVVFQIPRSYYFIWIHLVLKDHCECVKKTAEGVMFLTLYIDGILLTRNNMEIIKTTKWLSSILKVKDMVEAKCVLGIEITRTFSKKLLGLSYEAYINKILGCFLTHYSNHM